MRHVVWSRMRGVSLVVLVSALAAGACGDDADATPGSPDGSDAGGDAAPSSGPSNVADGSVGDAAADFDADASAGWPTAPLPAADATEVDPSEFLSTDQLRAWQADLDGRGLRATAGAAHEAYIDELHDRLGRAGAQQIGFEPVTLSRWSVDAWSVAVTTGPTAGAVQTASYVPYSGSTPATGLDAPLVYLPAGTAPSAALAGKIVLFDVTEASVPLAYFTSRAVYKYDPGNVVVPTDTYKRPYLALPSALLDALQAAGAVGAIGIIPAPYETAKGSYYPYDGKLRALPSVFVDRDVGARLKTTSDGTTQVKLTLPATVTSVQTRNLVAVIPGATDDLTVINSHTDGTNGIEDNGPNAIIAMTQYLARLPQASLPRTIKVLLSSGHFAGGAGAQSFLTAHATDGVLAKITSLVTVEHLGAEEWLPDANGILAPTGRAELSGFFMPDIQALEDASYAMAQLADCAPALVMTPTNPTGTGLPNSTVWPGEGQYFWGIGRIPTVNYITGPTYLLTAGITTVDKVDFDRMRRETVAFTQMLLGLSRLPASSLKQLKN